jgi:hypothetical protein
MLDYDKACGRDTPSVACIVDPFTGTNRQAAFWGTTPHYLPSKLIHTFYILANVFVCFVISYNRGFQTFFGWRPKNLPEKCDPQEISRPSKCINTKLKTLIFGQNFLLFNLATLFGHLAIFKRVMTTALEGSMEWLVKLISNFSLHFN